MNKEDYKKFKEEYLKRFIKYYVEANAIQKKEVKRSIFENKNLTDDEKEDFWNDVIIGGKNAKTRKK